LQIICNLAKRKNAARFIFGKTTPPGSPIIIPAISGDEIVDFYGNPKQL
jgi:hypothetical protein